MLPEKNRLKKKKDFERVFKKGRGFEKGFLYSKTAKNNLKENRFGFVVSKKISLKAVVRNKIKRQLREIVKKKLSEIKPGIDEVIIVKPGFKINNFQELEKMVNDLFRKAGILK